ncbi:MAG: VWA domain-containing protein [Planctomycetes bacterium]|nr:VWA domain-containing protein [Planctomycetota bacterium]
MSKNTSDNNLVEIACVACGKKLRIGREFVGRHGRCPHCKTKFLLKEPDSPPPQEPEEKDLLAAPVDLSEGGDGDESEEYDETPSFAVILPWWEEWLHRLRTAGPCWIVSMAVHLVLLILLAVITVTIPEKEDPGVQVNVQLKIEKDKKDVYLKKEDIQKNLDQMLPVRTSIFTAPDASPTAGIAAGPGEAGVVPVIGITGSTVRGSGNPFAVATGPVSFFGSGGGSGVSSVVFVVDRSASMEGERLKRAKQELNRSIQRLTVANMFNVIFFSDHGAHKPCWENMALATTEHKAKAYEFVKDMTTYGSTEPASAMKQAISSMPDLIYFLTDGEFDKGVVSEIRNYLKYNANGKKIRINTIAFQNRGGESLLRRIAGMSMGQYRYVP